MRRHANKQNSIPNNLRAMATAAATTTTTTTGSSTAATPTTNQQQNNNNSNNRISNVSGESSNGGGSGIVGDTTSAGSIGGVGKTVQLKSTRIKDTRDAKAKRNEWRITKMVLAIFLSFILCYLPITLSKVADNEVNYPAFHIFGYIMLYLSACINPIIYVIMNKQYRQAYKTVVLCKPSRLLAFTQTGSSVGGKLNMYQHSVFAFVCVRVINT